MYIYIYMYIYVYICIYIYIYVHTCVHVVLHGNINDYHKNKQSINSNNMRCTCGINTNSHTSQADNPDICTDNPNSAVNIDNTNDREITSNMMRCP